MKGFFISLSIITLLFSGCVINNETIKNEKAKTIIGSEEYIYIPAVDLKLKARIDTGARTSSLHALDINEFKKDGKKWIGFKLEAEHDRLIALSLPVERLVNIKRHGMEDQIRYVVKLKINLGKISKLVDVSLTNRSKFIFPALIGRNFLNNDFIVDVSKKYETEPTKK